MDKYAQILKKYQSLNHFAKKNGAVFFGGDWLSKIPVCELVADAELEVCVHNRSLEGLCLDDADKVADVCIYQLCPQKLFINVGENDISKPDFDVAGFAEKYEWLLYTVHSRCNCSIYILSIAKEGAAFVNEVLKDLAEKYDCVYIDVEWEKTSLVNFFAKLKHFLRKRRITFFDAMKV